MDSDSPTAKIKTIPRTQENTFKQNNREKKEEAQIHFKQELRNSFCCRTNRLYVDF